MTSAVRVLRRNTARVLSTKVRAELVAFRYFLQKVFRSTQTTKIHALSPEDIQTILEEEDVTHFAFTTEGFAWQHLQATSDEIDQIRQNTLISYGSCSFDEPREDLQALGLM